MTSATANSHGLRSVSVSGRPLLIFATFWAEWRSSPSLNFQQSRSARRRPIVLLPAPETPTTTATTETSGVGRTVHRSRLAGCIMLRSCPSVDRGGISGCSTRIFEGSAKDRWPARCPTRRTAQRLEGDYQLAHSDQQSGIAG